MIYTISGRSKPFGMPITQFIKAGFPDIPIDKIDSVFGFVERSTLYGGREFGMPELIDRDVGELYSLNIGLRIPLTNHYVTAEEYQNNRPLLDKYHRQGNAIITTNDDLAQWIKRDYPFYRIEASVIKNINSHDKIQKNLELYDTVVLPMKINNDLEFLNKIDNKSQVTLFANAGCALNCPSKICYPSISKANKFTGERFQCSQTMKFRNILGMIDFDLDKLSALGFSRFKVLRSRGVTGY